MKTGSGGSNAGTVPVDDITEYMEAHENWLLLRQVPCSFLLHF